MATFKRQVGWRSPPELADALADLGKQNNRSINGEITVAVKTHLQAHGMLVVPENEAKEKPA